MKRFLKFMLCAAMVVALGACNEKGLDGDNGDGGSSGGGSSITAVEQQLQGGWIAVRQVVNVKVGDVIIDQEDDILGVGEGMALYFTSGKQLFAMFVEEGEGGKLEVYDAFYAGQWSVDKDNKLTVNYVDNGDEGLGGDGGLLDLESLSIKSISAEQLIFEGTSNYVLDGQSVVLEVIIYVNREDTLSMPPVVG